MAVQYGVGYRNYIVNGFQTVLGASALLHFRTGAQPANCAAANSGTLLSSLTLPATFMAAASNGSAAKNGTWSGTAVATGVVGHYRFTDNPETTCEEQGSVTATGGGGDIEADNVNLASGQALTVSTYTKTATGA